MALTASFGMYDGAGVRSANDRLWQLVAARLVAHHVADVPQALDRDRPLNAIWADDGLLLAQCCGYPLVTRYNGRLRYVATPRYAVPGHDGPYCSRIIVRADDPAGGMADLRCRHAALNDGESNSGANLFRAAIAPFANGGRFFAGVVETGSHAASIRAVADGKADVAAIDVVSFAHAIREAPMLGTRVRTLGWTPPSPGLPFVTSMATPEALVRLLRVTLDAVVRSAEARPACETLFLTGIEHLASDAYDGLLDYERDAAAQGYPELV